MEFVLVFENIFLPSQHENMHTFKRKGNQKYYLYSLGSQSTNFLSAYQLSFLLGLFKILATLLELCNSKKNGLISVGIFSKFHNVFPYCNLKSPTLH